MSDRSPDAPMRRVRRLLPDEAATEAAGAGLAATLSRGDRIWLIGPLGAGKSAFARAAIRSMLDEVGRSEPIPSPTYTLVQAYDSTRGAVLHADLHRLSGPEEAEELGLDDPEAIAMIEWPDRLGAGADPRRLEIELSLDVAAPDSARRLEARGYGGDWTAAFEVLGAVGAPP